MKSITCVYFETRAGRRPVEEFVDAMRIGTQAKFFSIVDMLESYGM